MGKTNHFWFRIVCIILTMLFLIEGLWLFISNESTSLVEFKSLGKRPEIDIYPSISLCPNQLGMIKESKLIEDNITDNAANYKNFLFGKFWDERMESIDYDDYTIDLQDYLTKIEAEERAAKKQKLYEWTRNNTRIDEKDFGKEKSPLYISYRSDKDKCFTVDVDKDIVKRTESETIRTVIFQFSNFVIDKAGLNIFIHYPRQIFRSLPVYKILNLEGSQKPEEVLVDEIIISNMVVIRRRNTWAAPCDEQWNLMDESILKSLAESVGCMPRHWKLENTSLEYCDSAEKMTENLIPPAYNFDSNIINRLPHPCNQLQILMHESGTNERDMSKWSTITTGENTEDTADNLTRVMEIFFDLQHYQEVQHIQGFDIGSLIGNVGGYIGMFLGVALWQLPELLGDCYVRIKSSYQKKKRPSSNLGN